MDVYSISKTFEAASTFAAMPGRLRLNLDFNRYPPGRFADDVDPLDAKPLATCLVPWTPTPEISDAELAATLGAFKFPARTDGVRGLLWGPFKNDPEEEDEKVIITLTDSEESSRTDSASTAATDETEIICTAPEPLPKQQRILPILRAPLIIRMQPKLKRRRDSTDEEDQCIRVAKAERLWEDEGLPSIVEVALALQPVCIPKRKSRITLCASSRLKYGC